MTLSEISTKITELTGQSTVAYPNANRLININIWGQKVVSMILDSQDESDFDDQRRTDYPVLTTPLTTNRDYTIPVSEKVLKIKDVSISYDGTNVYRASPFDVSASEFPITPSASTTANSLVDSYFSKTSPSYDIKYNSVFIYPVASSSDVSGGGFIVFEWFREFQEFTLAELTTGTEVPGFDSTFHAILAYGAAYEWAFAKSLPAAPRILQGLQEWENRLRKQYSSKQLDRNYRLTSSQDNENYK